MKYFEKVGVDLEDVILGTAGTTIARKSVSSGNITGREVLYHTTSKKNVENIKKRGIRSIFAKGPENITNTALTDVSMKKKKGKVYLTRKPFLGAVFKVNFVGEGGSKIFKVKAPTWKMKEVANPELRGTKSADEFYSAYKKTEQFKAQPFAEAIPESMQRKATKSGYKSLGPKGTATIEGGISPRYIKASKHYKSTTFKEIGQFMKKHPKRLAKGVAGLGVGLTLLGHGITGGRIKQK